MIIESKFEPQPIDLVEVLLLAHELRLNKFKQSSSDSPSINLTQVSNKQDPESFSNFRGGSSHAGSYSGGFNHNGGCHGGASSGTDGGGGHGLASIASLISNVKCVTSMGKLLLFSIFALIGIISQIPL